MALLPRRRKDKQRKEAEKAYQRERTRQSNLMRDEARRDFFATQEGQGVMERATISLGYEEEEDDLSSVTGLII